MAKGHRSQIKRERNAQKDTRPSAKLSYARVSVQKELTSAIETRGTEGTDGLCAAPGGQAESAAESPPLRPIVGAPIRS